MTATVKNQIIHDFSPGRSRKVDALLDSASRLGQEAKEAALKHVVRPTFQAARQAGEALEETARQTTTRVGDMIHQAQDTAMSHPRQALGYAFGAGLLLGLLLHRRA